MKVVTSIQGHIYVWQHWLYKENVSVPCAILILKTIQVLLFLYLLIWKYNGTLYTNSIQFLGCDVNLPNITQDTPLYIACEKGLEEMVDLLLSQPDIQVNAGKRNIPLHAAARMGYISIATKLLQHNAHVNRVYSSDSYSFFTLR